MDPAINKDENGSLQADEIQALSAILGDDIELDGENSFNIKIRNSLGNEVSLQVILPEMYPLNAAPLYEFSAPWMNREAKLNLSAEIEDIYNKYLGESIIYMWVEAIKDFIEDKTICETNPEESDDEANDVLCPCVQNLPISIDIDIPTIEHGDPIIDRKSVFQAHLARIGSESQIQLVMNKLKENPKIAEATHNVYAYRISLENGNFIQDYEDDREGKAGSVLLHLLQVSNLSNILIVVTRWYGGVHLGSHRFRHYMTAAKNLVSEVGLTKDEKIQPSSTRKILKIFSRA